MKNLAEIKRRIESVRETEKITSAMETISVAKMRKALKRYEANRHYYERLLETVKTIFSFQDSKNIYTEVQSGKPLLIVLASDKSLCGGFNHEIFKVADSLVTQNTVVMPIGQMSVSHYSKCDCNNHFTDVMYDPHFIDAKNISDEVMSLYGNGISSVTVVYSKMISHASGKAEAVRLLPIESDNVGASGEFSAKPDFVPSKDEILPKLISHYISGCIYGMLVNTFAAENVARRQAMSSSTENARELISSLTTDYHRARQDVVTNEITEIAASSQAVALNNKF